MSKIEHINNWFERTFERFDSWFYRLAWLFSIYLMVSVLITGIPTPYVDAMQNHPKQGVFMWGLSVWASIGVAKGYGKQLGRQET